MFSFKIPLVAALLVTVMTVASPKLSLANDADFVMKNRTGYQIDEVYVSVGSSKSWGKDLMGSDSLANGEQLKVTFPHGNGACMFDIKVKYHDDNSTAEWTGVNLCKYEIISLFWDNKSQVTRAVGE